MRRDDVTPIYRKAVQLFSRSGSDEDPVSMKTSLDQIGSLDRQFREAIPDFEARLHEIIEAYCPFSER